MSNIGGSWKPNGRPQSTIAQNFSAALNDAFSIDSSPDSYLKNLVQSVEQKKRAVNSQAQELEALEARLRETEERLKRKQPSSLSLASKPGKNDSPHRRQPLGQTSSDQEHDQMQKIASDSVAARSWKVPMPVSRADSYRTPPMPGALPQMPGVASSVEY